MGGEIGLGLRGSKNSGRGDMGRGDWGVVFLLEGVLILTRIFPKSSSKATEAVVFDEDVDTLDLRLLL